MLLAAAPAVALSSPSATAAEQVVALLHADRVEYLERERVAILTGRVRVGVEDAVIAADLVRFDQAQGLITAEGNLTWVSPTLSATGRRMTWAIRERQGDIEDVSLAAGLWLCRGDRVSQSVPGEVDVAPGLITTCDRAHPHYAIRCRTIHIRLNRDLTARSVTLFLGRTPVLWLPYLYTPLREFRLPFEAQVGRTAALGTFVRTSPAYALGSQAPGRARIDWFQRTGWGLGATQELLDARGGRLARVHGYHIAEASPSFADAPRRRWELFAEGAGNLSPATRISGHAALVSDARFRETYGYRSLPLPLVAGDRRANLLLTRRLAWADASFQAERTDTQRVSGFSLTDTGRYTISSVKAPRAALDARPMPLTRWLSLFWRAEAERSYDWLAAGDDADWYVARAAASPALEAYGRVPLAGRFTVTPRLTAEWRDRGDRVLLTESDGGGFREDANRGGVYRAMISSSLRRALPLGVDAELEHQASRRLNKIGYDPYGYRGLDLHQARGRVEAPLGPADLTVRGGYDLRDTPDPARRRWLPLTAQVAGPTARGVTLSAEGDYDLRHRAWRRAAAAAAYETAPGGLAASVRPSFTDNRLALPLAVTTSPEYRVSRRLYGASVQDAVAYPTLFLVDITLATPIAPGFRAALAGQADVFPPDDVLLPPDARGPVQRHLRFYALTITRDLHCWELAGSFERYASGELRFNASLNLKAFPTERFPLISL